MKATDPPVIVEEEYKVKRDVVWDALTNPETMRKWYFENIPDFQPKVGFKTKFIVENEGRVFPHLWEVTEVVPLEKISYTWRFENWAGDGYVVFTLSDTPEGTKLKLENFVTEDFDDSVPEFKRESCEGGWTFFLKQRLKNFLDEHDKK
ncbi:MAG: SRPBCC domain-containing protein [Ignavibacteria bacterium]|nr:MAG: SRPBCC domain-containing protein [Ignavibacteria bacterium]